MIIFKFGGTSLNGAARYRHVANLLTGKIPIFPAAAAYDLNLPVVVVSAQSGITDTLIAGARAAGLQDPAGYHQASEYFYQRHRQTIQELFGRSEACDQLLNTLNASCQQLDQLYASISTLGELTLRTRDRVVAFGERLSAATLATLLNSQGRPAEALDAANLIVTDSRFGDARPHMELTCPRVQTQLGACLRSGVIPVVTGYLGATPDGTPTTLGRSGSDYSAAILGACLQAEAVWIWSDVNGILTADPGLVPNACTLDELTYAEARSLAEYGADVLHPKTIQPLQERGIPLRLLNSFAPDHPGTQIIMAPGPQRQLFPAIITSTGLTLISLEASAAESNLVWSARILHVLQDSGLDIPMFSQSFAERNLNLIIRRQDQAHCLQILENNLNGSARLEVKEHIATISIVGFPGRHTNGIIPRAFGALGTSRARLVAVAQAASEHALSVCIPEKQVAEIVHHLHASINQDLTPD